MRLGKLPKRIDPRTLKMARYLGKPITAPASQDWTAAPAKLFDPPWPMLLNDTLGDCVPAASGHMIAEWTANAGNPFMPSDAQIVKAYEAIGGYVPGDPSTDNGCAMIDALNYWRKTGIAGQRITGYVEVDPRSPSEIKKAVWLFGAAYIGLQLPISAQGATSWYVSGNTRGQNAPGTWGGHCVPIVGFTRKGVTVITWGQTLWMTWEFLSIYSDEAYAVLSQDWIEANQQAPNNFDLSALVTDLQKL